jgi:hypothetical protein
VDVPAGSGIYVWWKCDRGPDHEWKSQARSRTIRGTACRFCANKQVAPSMAITATHPEIAAQWHPTRNGTRRPDEFTYGSHFDAIWQCPLYKTHVWPARISTRTVMLAGCPSCARLANKGTRPKARATKGFGSVTELDPPSIPVGREAKGS